MAQTVVVVDAGGCSARVGAAGQEPQVFPNCTAKVKGERQLLVGDMVLACKEVTALSIRRPVDRGYVVAWDMQRDILSRAVRQLLRLEPSGCGLVITEPYFNLPAMRDALLQVVFQELGFASVYVSTPAQLSLRWHAHRNPLIPANAAGCGLVVDAGFSFTHAVPVFDWRAIPAGIKRIDLGGKALTNYMKELVSYRSINMMDEAYLMEHIKNQLCFVSQDVQADLRLSQSRKSPYRQEYVLPDGITDTWGHVKSADAASEGPPQKQTVLLVNNERFMVPEALFHPTDIGMEEAGLAEAIVDAVQSVHPHLHGLLFSNVLLSGGSTKCPGFRDRLFAELRPLVPDDYELNVYLADDPGVSAWAGASLLAASPLYTQLAISRADYAAHGQDACAKWAV